MSYVVGLLIPIEIFTKPTVFGLFLLLAFDVSVIMGHFDFLFDDDNKITPEYHEMKKNQTKYKTIKKFLFYIALTSYNIFYTSYLVMAYL